MLFNYMNDFRCRVSNVPEKFVKNFSPQNLPTVFGINLGKKF